MNMSPEHLLRAGMPEAALAGVDAALLGAPGDVALRGQRTALLIELRRFDEAMAEAEALLREVPDQLQALNSLAIVLVERNRLGDALAVFRRAFALAPTNARLLANYGNFLSYAGLHEIAVAAYAAAVSLAPQDRDIGVNHGMTLLRAGLLRPGWEAFEERKRAQDPLEISGTPLLPPLSTGPDLKDRSVLVFHEQGLGDSLQFLRYVPLLARTGAKIWLRMPPPLARIAASVEGCTGIVATDQPIAGMDYVVPMMSLPRIFDTVLDTIPADIPYLHPEPAAVERWRSRLAHLRGPRIGLVWAGSPEGGLDHRRSIAFDMLRPLFKLPVSFVSLQIGAAGKQWAPPPEVAALDPTGEIRDFADTAALIGTLDLVISVDTSTAHAAGALGKPIWILDRFDSCWRWLSGRHDSPWYPTLRLIRPSSPGDWPSTIAQAVELFRQSEFFKGNPGRRR